MSETLFIIKPDAVERKLIGKILHYIEKYGFKIENMKMVIPNKLLWKEHYEEFEGKKIHKVLYTKMANRKVVAIKVSKNSENCWKKGRKLLYKIRHEYATGGINNVIHCSDSEEASRREIKLWGL